MTGPDRPRDVFLWVDERGRRRTTSPMTAVAASYARAGIAAALWRMTYRFDNGRADAWPVRLCQRAQGKSRLGY